MRHAPTVLLYGMLIAHKRDDTVWHARGCVPLNRGSLWCQGLVWQACHHATARAQHRAESCEGTASPLAGGVLGEGEPPFALPAGRCAPCVCLHSRTPRLEDLVEPIATWPPVVAAPGRVAVDVHLFYDKHNILAWAWEDGKTATKATVSATLSTLAKQQRLMRYAPGQYTARRHG